MEQIDIQKVDYKSIVREGYQKCAHKYQTARLNAKEKSLDLIINKLPSDSKILDIGCGGGIPVDLILSEKYKVTGIDISENQIQYARTNVPNAEYYCQDILSFDFASNYWDCIISYYAIFHLAKKIN